MIGRRVRASLAGVCTAAMVSGVAVALTGVAAAVPTQAAVVLPGSVPSALARQQQWQRLGAEPAAQRLTLQVWLRPELGAAARFALAASTPGTASYGRYQSSTAYTARFGPSAAQAAAVRHWLTAAGLHDVAPNAGRDYVSAAGTVGQVQRLLSVRVDRYRIAGVHRTIRSNDRPLTVPAGLAADVLGVTGVSDVPVDEASTSATRRAPSCSNYWGQRRRAVHPHTHGVTSASLPICGYSAGEIRAAYGASTRYQGRGVTVALSELDATVAMPQTLRDFARRNHLPAPTRGQFRQTTGSCHPSGSTTPTSAHTAQQPDFDPESQLDSESVYAMAPRAKQLMVVAPGCSGSSDPEDQGLVDADLTVLEGPHGRPRASLISNSWSLDGGIPASVVHALDTRAAAEGVGMYFSSGDTTGVSTTTADPMATTVGGTTLALGRHGSRVFETGWSTYSLFRDGRTWAAGGIAGAAGGGVSSRWREPAYQRGVVPWSMSRVRVGTHTVHGRTSPDIAADADPDSGMTIGYIASEDHGRPGPYRTTLGAGTSMSCPLVAGLVAAAQQGRTRPFGFLNPLLYRLTGTDAYRDVLALGTTVPKAERAVLHTAGGAQLDLLNFQRRGTSQVTAPGYDTTTGLGTPGGPAFVARLRRAG